MTVRDTTGESRPSSVPDVGSDAVAASLGGPLLPVKKRYRPGSLEIFGAVLLLAIVFRGPLESLLGHPVLQSWSTVFVAICVQATPFLVLGVVVSGAIAAFVPAKVFTRLCRATLRWRCRSPGSAAPHCPAANAVRYRSRTG